MKFVLRPPAEQETKQISIESAARKIEFEPALVKGTHIIKTAYVTARGEGGVESKAVVLFNGRTGAFTIQQLDADPPKLDFDLSPAKFNEKREKARTAGAKGQTVRRSRAPAQPPGDG